jgi:uncharacterized protein
MFPSTAGVENQKAELFKDKIMVYVILFLSACLQAIGGFGGGLFAVPLLTFIYQPKFIVPAFALLIYSMNLISFVESRKKVKWDLVNKLIIGCILGLPFGVYALKYLNQQLIKFLISLVTLIMGIVFISGVRIKLKASRPLFIFTGILSGFLSGTAAMGSPPLILLGVSLKLKKDIFRTTLLGIFIIMGTITNLLFLANGLFSPANLKITLFAFLPALAGSLIGIRIKNRLREDVFRKAVLTVIIIIGFTGTLKALLQIFGS